MKKLFVLVFILLISQSINLISKELKVGESAPEFQGETFDGKIIKLSDYKDRVVLLDFWASWCAPCQKELPYLMQLYDDNDDRNFVIIAVNIDKKMVSAQKFLEKLTEKANFPIIWDSKSEIPILYSIESMPTTIFIDKNGIIKHIHTGFTDSSKDLLKQELEELLK
ncbi:MAG: TlpA family protein disulfide reductase [Ignavibacteriae bacterium]|nr:TlpA family protein disulfide reductase [Ignavibacteriota bacterium]